MGALWNSLSQWKCQLMNLRHHFHQRWWSNLIAVITWPNVKPCWLTETDILLNKRTLKQTKKTPTWQPWSTTFSESWCNSDVAVKRCHIQQKSEDYSSLYSWSPYDWAESNCWTFALDKTKSDTNERPLWFNSGYSCLIIPLLIPCMWKTVHRRLTRRTVFRPLRAEIKIVQLCLGGVTGQVLIIQESCTWHHLEHRKILQTPNGIILQMTALSLSLHRCRGRSIWDSHNCYHLFNPPSKSRSSLQIKYLECLCSLSCIIVHH